MPLKAGEIIKILEHDGWGLVRTNGHRCRAAERHVESGDRGEHPEAGRSQKGAAMKGYVVVVEGDAGTGYSAYSPTVPGVVAAGGTREETKALMVEAMTEHFAILRESGEAVPEPVDGDEATILAVPAA
jgi:predicted RNase H-like HicB family nuclease